MLEKYDQYKDEFQNIEREMSLPETVSNINKIKALSRRHSELRDLLEIFESLKRLTEDQNESQKLLATEKEPEMREFMESELAENQKKINDINQKIQLLLIPKDPNDSKNVILEIRAGTGGDEAALFAGSLFRMYCRYAEKMGWKVSVLSSNTSGIESIKEVVATLQGANVYENLRYESGVHRVQRVPETESSGRIHTSAATVAVMPEAEEIDMEIEAKDIRIDVFRSSGPGGQSVNTTDSAVRITHIPTGLVVSCQDEKSQMKNRDKAMTILRARLLAAKQEEEAKKRADMRNSQIGTGDRSEKIRTYNFPQDRVTDHRINYSVHNLPGVLNGDLDPLISEIKRISQELALKNLEK